VKNLIIYDPSGKDNLGQFRGGGRIMQILRENFPEAEFISDLSHAQNFENTLFIPSWQPFEPSRLGKPMAKRQILMIFDVIPVKFPKAFPVGIRGKINFWRNKRALKNLDKILTISEHSKKDIVRHLGIPADKVAVVYPTVSKMFLGKEIQNSELKIKNELLDNSKLSILNSKFVLYVGDVNWNKNLVTLAKAIKLANVTCVFVGQPFGSVRTATGDPTGGRPDGAESPQGVSTGGTREKQAPSPFTTIQVGCKTGTAESHLPSGLPHAWFTVFAPFDNPEIVLTVMVEESGQGSNVAGPVAKEILKAYFERNE